MAGSLEFHVRLNIDLVGNTNVELLPLALRKGDGDQMETSKVRNQSEDRVGV